MRLCKRCNRLLMLLLLLLLRSLHGRQWVRSFWWSGRESDLVMMKRFFIPNKLNEGTLRVRYFVALLGIAGGRGILAGKLRVVTCEGFICDGPLVDGASGVADGRPNRFLDKRIWMTEDPHSLTIGRRFEEIKAFDGAGGLRPQSAASRRVQTSNTR